MIYANGDKYTGFFKNNQKNGFGTYNGMENGQKFSYEGLWESDLRNKRGCYNYPNGDFYDGEFF